MSTLQKAMVLLDIARDHYRMPVMDEMTYRMQSTISARFSCYSRRLFQVA